jgi:predicted secreted hydrolase
VHGRAWLDHEWSSRYLDAEAAGWDWIGLNFDDGAALMAFRIRGRAADTHWAGGSYRATDGAVRIYRPDELTFVPGRIWRSPRTGIEFPVTWTVHAADLTVALSPLMDDQESDSRLSTGAIYWEGAVFATAGDGRRGRGYLELTGYGAPLRLPGTGQARGRADD